MKDMLPEVLESQFRMYPLMQVQDLYKLVYQGVMGSGHAIDSPEEARNWLHRETGSLGSSSPGEPLYEHISADGGVIRVNLRTLIASGGSADSLLTAFIRTGLEFRGSPEELVNTWERVTILQDTFEPQVLDSFFQAQMNAGLKAIHHSAIYREQYRPAYRVAMKELCLEAGIISS